MTQANSPEETSRDNGPRMSSFQALRFAGIWTILYGGGLILTMKFMENHGGPFNNVSFYSLVAALLIPACFITVTAGETAIENVSGAVNRIRQRVRPS